MIGAEAALRTALLDTLVAFPRCIHISGEGLGDAIWEYEKAAARAYAAVAEAMREAAERLSE